MGRPRNNRTENRNYPTRIERTLVAIFALMTAVVTLGMMMVVAHASPAPGKFNATPGVKAMVMPQVSPNLKRVDLAPSAKPADAKRFVVAPAIEQAWDLAIADKEASQINDGVMPTRARRYAARTEAVDLGLGFSLSTPDRRRLDAGYVPFAGWGDVQNGGTAKPAQARP